MPNKQMNFGTDILPVTDSTYVLGTESYRFADVQTDEINGTIVPDNPAFTDTTYSTITGATASTAGTSGLVPAPAAGDDGKYLRGDGVWATISSGSTTFEDVAFSITTSSWTLSNGEYVAEVVESSVTATAGIDVLYDKSIRSAMTADIFAEKGSGKVVFSTNSVPAATVTGTIRVFDGPVASMETLASKADKANPVLTGTFSHNRKANTTVGTKSFASGDDCEASGEGSHAENRCTVASGYYAHAEGNYTIASGISAHAEGTSTIANHESQHVFGEYNAEDDSAAGWYERGNYVEIVGNGTSSSAKSNARTLDWSGNEKLAGNLTLNAFGSSPLDVASMFVPWEVIIDTTATNDTQADVVIDTDSNGDPFELTDAIVIFSTPTQETIAKKGDYGRAFVYDGNTSIAVFYWQVWEQAAGATSYNIAEGQVRQYPGGLLETQFTPHGTYATDGYVRETLRPHGDSNPQHYKLFPNGVKITKVSVTQVQGTYRCTIYGRRKPT